MNFVIGYQITKRTTIEQIGYSKDYGYYLFYFELNKAEV